ncbi:uncharacterized protein LOC26536245 [Drosophila yakuba]|uniref:Protein TsetseEP domain-containing protein n=1 Tax=Drosophila yakuba TaxID=7245 RepID=A0A0R1DLE7_DROYA|nr:uncharacterized protein LOC26536245 [Drosophila yakuba]KRJ98127.1 uncharacterized protein Dyak_GE29064 [Drosophila yakuba]
MRLQFIPVLMILYPTLSLANSLEESCTTSSEMENRCAAVCYPTVKPLLRYMEVCERNLKLTSENQAKLKAQDIELMKCMEDVKTQRHNLENLEGQCNFNGILRQSFEEVRQVNSKLRGTITELQSKKYEELYQSYLELTREKNYFKNLAKRNEKEAADVRSEFVSFKTSCERQLSECSSTEDIHHFGSFHSKFEMKFP